MHTISEYQKLIENEIRELKLPEFPNELYEPVRYIMSHGGKRIRPVLTLLANELLGGNLQEALKPAIALEIFHNFTLVHDDVMDIAPLRRGKPTVHEKWNNTTAILSGDVMLVLAFEMLTEVKKEIIYKALELFIDISKKVCEGQQLDMVFENSDDVSIGDYLKMIGLKTASLFAGSLKMGALIANADDKDAENIYQFGFNAGIAFQIQDDILDAFGESENFGKSIGGDIAANKKTFLTVKAFELAEGDAKEELKYLFEGKHIDAKSKICEVLAIYDSFGVKEKAEKERDKYFEKALDFLDKINVKEENKRPLRALAEQLVRREK